MKKRIKIIALVVCFLLVVPFTFAAVGCNGYENGPPGNGPEEYLEFAGGDVYIYTGIEINVPIPPAVNENPEAVFLYTHVSGALPNGLMINPVEGTFTGTTDAEIGSVYTVRIRASASGILINPTEAYVNLRIVPPQIILASTTLQRVRAGDPLAVRVPRAQLPGGVETSTPVIYTVYPGHAYRLTAANIELREDGVVHTLAGESVVLPSFVTIPMPGQPGAMTFDVMANAYGYVGRTATMRLDMDPRPVTTAGTAITFAGVENALLATATRLVPFNVPARLGVAAGAIANAIIPGTNPGNAPAIRYSLASGSTLPQGFELFESGMLHAYRYVPNATPAGIGTAPDRGGVFRFSVVASAEGIAATQTRSFELRVNYAYLNFNNVRIEEVFTRGDAANFSITGAMVPEADGGGPAAGATYAHGGGLMPRGMSIVAGNLVGTPERAYGLVTFRVTANAPGYSPVTGDVFAFIQERIVDTGGIFEAEFLDMTGRSGSGASGAAAGTGMIERDGTIGSITGLEGFHFGWHYENGIRGSAVNPPMEFRFHSTAAIANAGLTVRLLSETGSVFHLNPDNYLVEVSNDDGASFTQVMFSPFSVGASFSNFSLGNIPIAVGWNIVTIRVLPNSFGFHSAQGAPSFDRMVIGNLGAASLTWRPHTYNLRTAAPEWWNTYAPGMHGAIPV